MRTFLLLSLFVLCWSQTPCTTLPPIISEMGTKHIIAGNCSTFLQVSATGIESGSQCSLACASGCQLIGSPTLSCINASWITPDFNCACTSTNVLITYVGENKTCTGDAQANPRILCSLGLVCSGSVCVKLNVTEAPTSAPTLVYGYPGDQCGDNRAPCLLGLICSTGICSVPIVSLPAPNVSQVGGKCGGSYNTICDGQLHCIPITSTQNVTLVGGICAATTEVNVTCTPGTQPVTQGNGIKICVPCLYGSFSEKGLLCDRCPANSYTPLPVDLNFTVALTVGPTHCTPCPTNTLVSDPACASAPTCEPSCLSSGKLCIWADSLHPNVSMVRVPRCVAQECPVCTATQTCFWGECKDLPANLTANATAILHANAALLIQAGVDPTDVLKGVATTFNGIQDGVLIVINQDTTLPQATLDHTFVVSDNHQVITNQLNLVNGSTTVLSGKSNVFAQTVEVVASPEGPVTARISAVPSENGKSKANFTLVNLDTNAISFSGDAAFCIGNITGTSGAFVQVSDSTLSGNISVTVRVIPDGDNRAFLNVNGSRLDITGAIVGGGKVSVNDGGVFRSNSSIAADVHVTGVVVFGNTSVQGAFDVTANGVLNISGNPAKNSSDTTSVPHLDNFTACQGVIYFHVDEECSKFGSRKGALWTSTINTNFGCQIYIVGRNNCQVGPLTVKTTVLTHARRLLGAPVTETSDTCNSATVNDTGATYQLCGSPNSASSHSLSSIALFVTLFVTFCLRLN